MNAIASRSIQRSLLLAPLISSRSSQICRNPSATVFLATPANMSSSTSTSDFPVQRSIESKLATAFAPIHHLEVRNESHMHNVPANSETHFKVIIASPVLSRHKTPLAKHRSVNNALAEEVAADGPVHALSIVAKTPEQWDKMVAEGKADGIGPSPNCRGGDGSLPKKNS